MEHNVRCNSAIEASGRVEIVGYVDNIVLIMFRDSKEEVEDRTTTIFKISKFFKACDFIRIQGASNRKSFQ
jgi:hypothetical protein